MATSTSTGPIRLLCVGLKRHIGLGLEKSLGPHYSFAAVVAENILSSQNVGIVLRAANPPLAGVIVGGGISSELGDEVETVTKEYNAEAGDAPQLKYLRVPLGSMDTMGREGVLKWIYGELEKQFGLKAGPA